MNPDLVTRLSNNDESCFREIYEQYSFKVYCFVKKYANQDADAEDITQNVFIHLWKYRERLNSDTPLESVLFKSSKQEISKWYKKQSKILSPDEQELLVELNDRGYDDDEFEVKMKLIENLLSQIPERRRKIFILHKFDDLSYKEIAKKMNMTTGAVANQISKTLQYLKKNSVKNNELYWFLLFFLNQL